MKTITYQEFEDAVAKVMAFRLHVTRAAVCMALKVSSFGGPEADRVQELLDEHLKPHPSAKDAYVP
jgi:hypothetical protein